MAGVPVIRVAPLASITHVASGASFNILYTNSAYVKLSNGFASGAAQSKNPGVMILGQSISKTIADDPVKGPDHCSVIANSIFPVGTTAGDLSVIVNNSPRWYKADNNTYNGGWVQGIVDPTLTPASSTLGGVGTALTVGANVTEVSMYMNQVFTGSAESMFEAGGMAVSWVGREIQIDGGTSTVGNELTFKSISDVDRSQTFSNVSPYQGVFFGHVEYANGLIKLNGPIQIGNTDGVTVTHFHDKNVFCLWTDNPVNQKFYRIDIVGAATIYRLGDANTPAPVIIDVAGSTLRWVLDTATDLPAEFTTYGITLKRGRAWKLGSTTTFNGGVLQDITDVAMDPATTITNAQIISTRLDYGLPPATGKLTGSTFKNPVDYCMTVSQQQAVMQIDYEFDASAKGAGKAINFTHTTGNIELQFLNGVTPLVLADITVSGAGTVSIPAAGVPLSVKTVDISGNPIANVRVYIKKVSDNSVIISGLTDVNGTISTTYSYTADEAVTGWARKSTAPPLYKQGVINATITSTGFASTVTMISDE